MCSLMGSFLFLSIWRYNEKSPVLTGIFAGQGREPYTFVVPPCFAAAEPQPCAPDSCPAERCNGRHPVTGWTKASPVQLRDHLRLCAACPVPSFGLSVMRRQSVLFSSKPIYTITSIIRKKGRFVNLKPQNPGRPGFCRRDAPCCLPLPRAPDGWNSP